MYTLGATGRPTQWGRWNAQRLAFTLAPTLSLQNTSGGFLPCGCNQSSIERVGTTPVPERHLDPDQIAQVPQKRDEGS
jgi:hypothetical protein